MPSVQMAKRTAKEFPNIPQMFEIDPSQESLNKQRRDMAEVILKGSGIIVFKISVYFLKI